MDFGFPAPYDHEVPRRIGEARHQLSPEGVAVLERIIAETGNLEDIIAAMESLPASDTRVLVGVSRVFAEAYDAQMRDSQGWADLQRQLAPLILRARELEPSLRAGATLGEAIVVLKRHGEPLGISDEVLEMTVELSEEEPPPSGPEL
jgi:transposase